MKATFDVGDRMRLRLLFLVGLATFSSTLLALAPQSPSFEVTSVKQNKTGATATSVGFQQGGRFRAVNEPLWRLIAEAYRGTFQLRRFEIVGGPDWIERDRFDIEAIPNGSPTQAEQRVMLQGLLADRFRLTTHRETRDLPIYHLVKARSDGRLGDRIRPSTVDCSTVRAGGPAPPPLQPGQARPCMMIFGSGHLSSNGMTITNLAEMGLSRSVERVVVDRTALSGGFQWTLEWTPDVGAASTSADRVSIFTALQEQLGLKLEPTKGPVDVLVIDHVERPTED